MVRSPYSEKELLAMIGRYEVLRAQANTSPRGIRALLTLADLDRALARLPMKYWEVVLVHGLIGLTTREAAEVLHISHVAVGKRFRQGVADALHYINGGI